jgi:hypothetical protein
LPDSPPGDSWKTLFANVEAQGQAPGLGLGLGDRISRTNRYYAYLSKIDLNLTLYDVLFEVMPYEWAENAIFAAAEDVPKLAPTPPASLYHVREVSELTIMSMLGLHKTDDLAEGSWYLLTLAPGFGGEIVGDLYDPDVDLQAG